MKEYLGFNAERSILLSTLILLALFTAGSKLYTFYQMDVMHSITTDLYEHPLKVSNAALTVQSEMYKIHSDLRELLLSPQLLSGIEADLADHEQKIYDNLTIIKLNILGDKGLQLQQETFRLFAAWTALHKDLIANVKAGRIAEAAVIFHGKGNDRFEKLEASATDLYTYAWQKADAFHDQSDSVFEELQNVHIAITALLMLLFGLIGLYAVNRISGYIARNKHLSNILTIIRNVNQLIVREKDPQRLIQNSCDILTSNHIYDNVWIVLYDDADEVSFIASSVDSDAFKQFKEKLNKQQSTPGCIDQVLQSETGYSVMENTPQNCGECSLLDQYEGDTSFTIALIHDEKTYGHMTLCITGQYIHDEQETRLLKEVASDIAYGLYNQRIEQELLRKEERYRYIVEATNDGVWDWDILTGKVYYSPRWKMLLGYRDDEIENTFEEWEKRLHPDDREGALAALKASQQEGHELYNMINRLKHKDGHWIWTEARGQTLFDKDGLPVRMIGSDRDITKEKTQEDAIHRLKELYENVIDSVENLIFVKDTSYTYITCNRAFERFIGKSRESIIGKNDYDLFGKEAADHFRQYDMKLVSTEEPTSNYEWVTYPDGQKVYLLTVKAPLRDSKGTIIGLVGNSADLTEQKASEEALKRTNDKFEKAFNNTPNIIVISRLATGHIYEVNRTFEKVLGYKREEVIGKTTFEIDLWNDFNNRESYIADLQEKAAVDGEIYTFKSKTGELITAQIYASLVVINNEEYILAVAEDITEKQEYMKQLEQKKKELETIIEEAPNPIMLHNEKGEVLMVNRVWEELSGYTYKEIDTIDKWMDKAYGLTRSQIKTESEKFYAIEHKEDQGEFVIRTKNGDSIVWQFSSAPLGVIDGKRTLISSAMDITELKKKDKLMMVQSRYAAMGEMIGMIAHQWRQPISGIAMDANNMLLDIALGDFRAEAAESYAKEILEQTEHLSRTIDDFRNFFKPDHAISKVNLRQVIQETYAIVKESLANNSIEFKTNFSSESEVNAYPRELMQVFVNIIHNAKDVLVAKNVKDALIKVRVFDDGAYVTTEICDNGGGINETILDKVFDPYFTTKDEKTGTGLGLYMSRMIIEEHLHGILEVSNTDVGACFRVRLLKNPKNVLA